MGILSYQEIHESALVSEDRLFNINSFINCFMTFSPRFTGPSVFPIKNERNLEAEDEGERTVFYFSLILVVSDPYMQKLCSGNV